MLLKSQSGFPKRIQPRISGHYKSPRIDVMNYVGNRTKFSRHAFVIEELRYQVYRKLNNEIV